MSEAKKGFSQFSKSWYVKHTDNTVKDEVSFGYYYADGSTAGEMFIRWYEDFARLECAEDNFHLLIQFPELYEWLGKNKSLTSDAFCDILRELEFEDLTPVEKTWQ